MSLPLLSKFAPLERIIETINAILRPPTFTAPTLLNSWANYGGGFNDAGYYKDPWGRVHLRGLIKDGTSFVTDLFVLPEGYRPANQCIFIAISFGDTSGYAMARVHVSESGTVHVSTGGSGTNPWLSLDGISFAAR